MKPPLDNPDCECQGHGYNVFTVDREPWLEIERTDACDCLARRLEKPEATDDDAALVFVRDLEKDIPYARERALWLLHGLPGSADDFVCKHCGSEQLDDSGPIIRCDNCREAVK